jgi:hypothetical protein
VIQFTLKCENDHKFESWFGSAEAFDKLKAAGMVTCAVCGTTKVEKALMAPRVRDSKSKPNPETTEGPLTAPSAMEQAMAEMRKQVE